MSFSSRFLQKTLNAQFQNDWAKENPQIIDSPHAFLSSFPRSGNGWIRVLLAAVLLEFRGIDCTTLTISTKMMGNVKYHCLNSENKIYDMQQIFPDIYHFKPQKDKDNIYKEVADLKIPVKLIKTHHIVDCANSKTIFLFREPLACLTSSALLMNGENLKKNKEEINQTIIYMMDFYKKMLEHYIEQYTQYPTNCFFLSHQKISELEKATEEISRITEFLGLEMKQEKLQKVALKFPFKSGYQKGYKKYIEDTTKVKINVEMKELYQKAIEISSVKN